MITLSPWNCSGTFVKIQSTLCACGLFLEFVLRSIDLYIYLHSNYHSLDYFILRRVLKSSIVSLPTLSFYKTGACSSALRFLIDF